MSGLRRLRVTELHPNLLCILCGGYYVDATTIVECLHSFCKTCIVRYLESSKFCPMCDVQVHKTKPLLSIRPDKTLQDIVYKLVPGLYQNEMCRRRDFYSSHPEAEPPTPEDGGRDLGRWYILPDDPVSVALHPAPSSYSPKCFNLRTMPASTYGYESAKTPLEENRIPSLDVKNEKDGSHIRYLQCPAGVSVAQLKRLLRAKFGVGPAHPITVLTCTSGDPLSDTLTLVDVAYITSWQRTEPLQLQYRIYERASKKIKLDPDTFGYEACSNSNEEMPKLEPNVGTEVNLSAYASLDATGNVMEYRCAPLLQAFETSDCNTSEVKEKPFYEAVAVGRVQQIPECKDCAADSMSTAVKVSEASEEVSEEVSEVSSVKDPIVASESGTLPSELTQGSHSDNGNVMKTDIGVVTCDSNSLKVENVTSGNNVVDTFVTYTGGYTAPSNGVNVGVTFIPSEMSYISSAGVPCALIQSGSCVPVSGDCIPDNVSVPTGGSGAALHRPLQGGGGTATDNVNLWVTAGLQTLVGDAALLPAESKPNSGEVKDGEEEGKEVQLTISESGIMSASGRGTTVEGIVNPFESETCELLSKIESGSLGEDFPPKTSEKLAQKMVHEANVINKKSKARDNKSVESAKCKVDGKGSGNKAQVALKGEKVKNANSGSVSTVNHKPSNVVSSKDGKETLLSEKPDAANMSEAVSKNKAYSESCNKVNDKKQTECRKQSEMQQLPPKDPKDCSNSKDSRASHIPASLTAASMANLNKPHLKAGSSKGSHVEEVKSREAKPNNSGGNLKKEGKQEHGKQLVGSCRKPSQPYGYKTLKTPPKSWNPTISREHLALGASKSSNGKGTHEPARPNKFFKARNAPRYLGNPSAGVKPMFSGTNDSANGQKSGGVVLKVDPKTLGPVTVPVSNDSKSSACLTTSVSNSTSSVSSGQSATPPATQTTMSIVGSLPTSAVGQTSASLQTSSAESTTTTTTVAISGVEDTVVTSTKGATMPTSFKSVARESTNSSSKAIGNKYATNIQENKVTHDINKSTSISGAGSKLNNKNSTPNRIENVSNVQTSISNPRVDVGGQTSNVVETKANIGNVGQLLSTMGNVMGNSNSSKLIMSTASPTCVTQLRGTTVNSQTSSAGIQSHQHFTLGSSAVGIIPSCGVSLPATIGTMPLPYYTSPSLGYPTYPYLYQSPDTIGLIPAHPSPSFIPTFPTCLQPRAPLSPRNIPGAKMLQDHSSLQPNLLPLVPISNQLPPQAMSPRPMTPPSPRTPTSNQSPKPYPSQSPRQSSSTNHSRPLTPHSPKTLMTGHTSRSPVQSPKLPTSQSGKSQSGNQPGQSITQPHTQTLGTQIPNSSHSPNSASKLNACVQTSLSHTLIMPKSNLSFITSTKPPVPHPSKTTVANQPVALSQQMASPSSCYSNSPQSPKPLRPKTPQSPKSSIGCTVPSVAPPRQGNSSSHAVNRQHTSQIAKCAAASQPSTDTTTTNVGIPRMAVTNQERSQSSILSLPLPFNQLATVFPTGGLTVPQVSALEGAVMHPQSLQVSVPQTMRTVSQNMNACGNSGSMALNKGFLFPDASGTLSSSHLSLLSATTHIPQSSVQNLPVFTPGSLVSSMTTTSTPACISAVPTCTSLPQNFPLSSSNASPVNSFGTLNTHPIPTGPAAPVSSGIVTELPKVTCSSILVSKENVASSASWNVNTSSSPYVSSPASTSCAVTTESSCGTVPRNAASLATVSSAIVSLTSSTVSSAIVSLPSSTSCNVSLPANTSVGTPAASKPSGALTSLTSIAAAASRPTTSVSAITTTSAAAGKVDALPTGTSAVGDVHTSSVATTLSSSTTASVAISSSITGSLSVPFNGTSDIKSPQCETSTVPPQVSTAIIAQSQSSGVLIPSGSSNVGGKSVVVVSAKEKGGNVPQSSACTPVCDVTHVIDAKLPCAEPNVSSSDGPRPCLKS